MWLTIIMNICSTSRSYLLLPELFLVIQLIVLVPDSCSTLLPSGQTSLPHVVPGLSPSLTFRPIGMTKLLPTPSVVCLLICGKFN